LKKSALPFLSRCETLDGFITWAAGVSQTDRALEGLGYALAFAGKPRQAIEVFDRLTPMLNTAIAWQRELADQVRTFRAKLADHPREAQAQLAAWEAESNPDPWSRGVS